MMTSETLIAGKVDVHDRERQLLIVGLMPYSEYAESVVWVTNTSYTKELVFIEEYSAPTPGVK